MGIYQSYKVQQCTYINKAHNVFYTSIYMHHYLPVARQCPKKSQCRSSILKLKSLRISLISCNEHRIASKHTHNWTAVVKSYPKSFFDETYNRPTAWAAQTNLNPIISSLATEYKSLPRTAKTVIRSHTAVITVTYIRKLVPSCKHFRFMRRNIHAASKTKLTQIRITKSFP